MLTGNRLAHVDRYVKPKREQTSALRSSCFLFDSEATTCLQITQQVAHLFFIHFFCFPGFPGPWDAFYRHLCFERAALGDPSEEVEALGEEEL